MAQIVLRMQGIAVSCKALPSRTKQDATETWHRVLRDVLRALVFMLCGADPGSVSAVIGCAHPDRVRASDNWKRSQQTAEGEYVLTIPRCLSAQHCR